MSSKSTSTLTITCCSVAAATVCSGLAFWLKTRKYSNSAIPTDLRRSEYGRELILAVQLAKKAGDNMRGYIESKGTLREDFYNIGEIETKSGAADFCTKVDVENEDIIIAGIQKLFPKHEIIGEESVGTGKLPMLTKQPTWIVDPIDGTTNFSQGIFMTCVSIGFCNKGIPVMGVVYAPATEEWYLAVAGHGAFRNGERIKQSFSSKLLSNAVICAEFGYSRQQKEIDCMLGAVARLLTHGCRGIRQLGSGVLDLCYVATGRLDVVYAGIANEGWKPWDYCAASVICQEAGCIIESIDVPNEKRFDLYSESVLCGTSRELVDSCRNVLLNQ